MRDKDSGRAPEECKFLNIDSKMLNKGPAVCTKA